MKMSKQTITKSKTLTPMTAAGEAYADRKAEIAYKAMLLAAKLDSHIKPGETINWAHVGDLGRIVGFLNEALGIEE
jgi:hypothetical protein